jgi:hypothetical protein
MLALALGLSAAAGFFKVVLDRFADDGGSAFTRLEMFEIFEYLPWRDIVIGADPRLIDSIRRTHGLEWGIENPVVRLLLYQGAAITAFLVAGFILYLVEIGRRLRPGAAMPFVFFLIVHQFLREHCQQVDHAWTVRGAHDGDVPSARDPVVGIPKKRSPDKRGLSEGGNAHD